MKKDKWEKCIIPNTLSILAGMNIVDKGGLQIGLVVNDTGALIGVVSDGDIRRAILNGKNLNDAIETITNKRPVILGIDYKKREAHRLMHDKEITCIPVLNSDNYIQDVLFYTDFINKHSFDNPIVLMAGGLGTRLKQYTKDCPKPLLEVGNKPILETIVSSFTDEGFYNIYIAVNYKSQMIVDYFGDGKEFGADIKYIFEEKRMGTAGAIGLKKEEFDMPIIVMNGDILTKVNYSELLDYHINNESKATMAVWEYQHQIPYGVVDVEENRIISLREKPRQSFLVNGGIYVLNPEVLDIIPFDEFYDMTSLFEELRKSETKTMVYPIKNYWIDIGRIDDYDRAKSEYKTVFKI